MIRFSAYKPLRTAAGIRTFDVSFDLEEGRLLAVFGPSGSGKTTLLRMLAGLTDPGLGKIQVGDAVWFDRGATDLPPQQRDVGMVFQDFALFPHLTVRQNLAFAARAGNIDELLERMELTGLAGVRPRHLSGGQQQRVALARALLRRPRLLLLDEPLSALDLAMRRKLRRLILDVHRQQGLTTILVSHDLGEVTDLADEALCIDQGQVRQRGKPGDLFRDGQGIY